MLETSNQAGNKLNIYEHRTFIVHKENEIRREIIQFFHPGKNRVEVNLDVESQKFNPTLINKTL